MTNLYGDIAEIPDPLPTPARVLTIGAHPDDAEFGAGGTLAKWAAAGAHVTILVVTDGSKGSWDPDADHGALVAARAREQRKAADRLGAVGIGFLGRVDGELEYTMDLRAEVCAWIRRTRPDVVLSHDPWQRYQLHPDHRATGLAAVDGVVAAREPLAFPDQLVDGIGHHRPSALLLWSADAPDHWEPIEGHVEDKIAALLCHASQGVTTMGGADEGGEKETAFRRRIERWAQEVGAAAGLTAAESFKRITP
ncbi:MAG TPA: PIG-L deacetylase family protein [Acidimicrobiia bacterium]|nr:PIG-L deacetylase family protein [Acidimicrobiia bacterium]